MSSIARIFGLRTRSRRRGCASGGIQLEPMSGAESRRAPGFYSRCVIESAPSGVTSDGPSTRSATVYVLAAAGGEQATAGAEAIVAATPAECAITLVAGADGRSADWPARAEILTLSPAAALAGSLAATTGDLVIVDGSCVPADGWLSRLQAAAYSDTTVASATAMTDRGDGTWRPLPLPASEVMAGLGAVEAFELVARRATLLRPRIPVAGVHATYVRRDALSLVGGFAETEAGPSALLADFCARSRRHGLSAVLADDVFLPAAPAAGVDHGVSLLPGEEQTALVGDPGPLRRSLVLAGRALRGLSVTLDARDLRGVTNGSQAYTSQLAFALAETDELAIRLVVAPDLDPGLAGSFTESGIELLSYEQAAAGAPVTALVHRPQQVFTPADLLLLHGLGERLVITHHDLIAYRIGEYHVDAEAWSSYRRTTRLALNAADRVLFSSEHALRDALGEDLVDPSVAEVVGIGIGAATDSEEPARPAAVAEGETFVLVLGTDYGHKNRPFALRLVSALRRECGWPGKLVFAGSHVAHASSREEEQALLAADPQLAGVVTDIGHVTAAERAWLLSHARAVCYPSAYEGFGLVPLEAARAGVACLYAAQSSLAEIAGADAATIVPWDASASARAAIGLLVDEEKRTAHLRALHRELLRFGWAEIAKRTLAAYEQTLRSPYRESAERAQEALERERLLAEHASERERQAALAERVLREASEQQIAQHEALDADFNRLVGIGLPLIRQPGGLLSRREQRGLMRIAARRWPHRVGLWPLALLGGREPARTSDGAEDG